MRLFKIIVGLVCLVAALVSALMVLGMLTFYFDFVSAICTLVLAGLGGFLIKTRNVRLSGEVKTLVVIVTCLFLGFFFALQVPAVVAAKFAKASNPCVNNLRQIDGAKQQWMLENRKGEMDTPPSEEIKVYFKDEKPPTCPLGGTYIIGRIGEEPKCSIGSSVWPNEHVWLTERTGWESWWHNFKMAYSTLLGLRHAPK